MTLHRFNEKSALTMTDAPLLTKVALCKPVDVLGFQSGTCTPSVHSGTYTPSTTAPSTPSYEPAGCSADHAVPPLPLADFEAPPKRARTPLLSSAAPQLPSEIILEIARLLCSARDSSARDFANLSSVCRGWRLALSTGGDALWEPMAHARFPRLKELLRLAPIHPLPSFRSLYRAQLAAETPAPVLPADSVSVPRAYLTSRFIFTVELTHRGSDQKALWVGPLERGQFFYLPLGPLSSPEWLTMPSSGHLKQGGLKESCETLKESWESLRARVLVSRRDDLTTRCIYNGGAALCPESGPQVWFDCCDLPTRCPWSRRRPGPPMPLLELMLEARSRRVGLFFKLGYDHDVPDMLEDELLFYLDSHVPWEA